jgi:hypothetical protein
MFKLTLGMVFRVERYLIIHLFRRDNVPCEWMKGSRGNIVDDIERPPAGNRSALRAITGFDYRANSSAYLRHRSLIASR